jgi:hypothetical protein
VWPLRSFDLATALSPEGVGDDRQEFLQFEQGGDVAV